MGHGGGHLLKISEVEQGRQNGAPISFAILRFGISSLFLVNNL